MKGLAVITGADGGMGRVVTLALAEAGYPVVMACRDPRQALALSEEIKAKSGNPAIEVRGIDLSSLASVNRFAAQMRADGRPVARLINNAGVLSTGFQQTEDGLESTVSVNYAAPYVLTRSLLPLMQPESRIVNTVSCTWAIGKIESRFFTHGRNGRFLRIPIYGNTKRALFLFTLELARRYRHERILANAADPGIVNTRMITMQQWFDPLTDIFFRPFIRTPEQGAATAVHLALSEEAAGASGQLFASCKPKRTSRPEQLAAEAEALWEETERITGRFILR